jgi:spermidine synthase
MATKRLLSAVFLCSGLSALIYQVVWQRLLATYYGVGPVSIALIVSVYIAGLGFGGLIGGYLTERLRYKIAVYGLIELGIGVFGVVSPDFLRLLGRHTAGSPLALALVYIALFLFIPTLLMGMTLPLLTKIFSLISANFFETVSALYFLNTLGAAAGALIASYILISFFGLMKAVEVAASINFITALAVWITATLPGSRADKPFAGAEAFRDRSEPTGPPAAEVNRAAPIQTHLVYLLVLVTGFLAIGYEIIWFRVIGVLVKDSPYAFSSILAVYLAGIALGSRAIKQFFDRFGKVDTGSLFFALQFLIGTSVCEIFMSYFYLTKHFYRFQKLTELSFTTLVHPGWYVDGRNIPQLLSGIFRSFDVFLWPLAFVLLPTLLMGASFPTAAALALGRSDRQGGTVGTVYFLTVIGNTLGGVLTGFVLLPFFGTEFSVALFAMIGIAFGVGVREFGGRTLSTTVRAAATGLLLIGVLLFFPGKGELYEIMHASAGKDLDFVFEEGMDGTVVTFHRNGRVRNFINGVAHGGRPIYSFYYETIEAMSRSSDLERVLVIGYGTGSIVETLLKSDEVKEIVLVEVNGTLLRNLGKIPLFATMLRDPRVHLIVDDGRRYLFNTANRFDLITTDALWSFTAYSNNLYSQEFYRLVQTHLRPRGVYLAWYDEQHVIPKTLASVFSQVQMFRSFSLAANTDLSINEGRRQRLLNQFSPAEQKSMLANGGYVGDRSRIEHDAKDYPINREWEPWTEYYLGLRAL